MPYSNLPLATVFGGSGFVGSRIVQLLARRGFRVRAAVRRPDLAGPLRMLGAVGQVTPVQANVRDTDSVRRATDGAEVVINLVGIGYERGRQRFEDVHVDGAARVAEAAALAGAGILVHMSALGADAESISAYASSKALGEQAVFAAFPEAVVTRPSLMFGPGDGFFNLMGTLSRYFPVLPLIGGKTRFQPVYVGDVAEAFALAADGTIKGPRLLELGGPEVLTHKALMQRILAVSGRRNPLLPMPAGVAKLLALPLGVLPWRPLITGDQVTLLGVDNVVSDAAIATRSTLEGIGIVPTPMDAILPGYMWRFRPNGQFDRQAA